MDKNILEYFLVHKKDIKCYYDYEKAYIYNAGTENTRLFFATKLTYKKRSEGNGNGGRTALRFNYSPDLKSNEALPWIV
jgi:hypothetical protein